MKKNNSPDKNNGNIKRLEAIMNDNSMSNEEKAKKFIEDVPTNFRELSGTKFSAARKHETLNRMFENLSQACNLNSQNS